MKSRVTVGGVVGVGVLAAKNAHNNPARGAPPCCLPVNHRENPRQCGSKAPKADATRQPLTRRAVAPAPNTNCFGGRPARRPKSTEAGKPKGAKRPALHTRPPASPVPGKVPQPKRPLTFPHHAWQGHRGQDRTADQPARPRDGKTALERKLHARKAALPGQPTSPSAPQARQTMPEPATRSKARRGR
jgi:hypothetical protein